MVVSCVAESFRQSPWQRGRKDVRCSDSSSGSFSTSRVIETRYSVSETSAEICQWNDSSPEHVRAQSGQTGTVPVISSGKMESSTSRSSFWSSRPMANLR